MKTLIVCHKSSADSGAFAHILLECGHEVDLRMAFDDPTVGMDIKEHDLALFMGGPMGVYQADIFPYLTNEINYIEKRLSAGMPYLGVCLGGQLMAKALGAKVYPGENGKEIGWYSIDVNEVGAKTAVKHLDASKTPMMQWHGDTFDLPKDATLLASSPQYKNQAISYGKNALGLQCHPEVTAGNIELWLATGCKELAEVDLSVPDLRQATMDNLPALEKQRSLFFNQWLDEISEGA